VEVIGAERDDQVVALRTRGRSYAGIAKELGFERTVEASEAFNRAVRLRPDDERSELRSQEEGRLDALAEKTRRHPDLSTGDVERRLQSIERLRTRLNKD
jgi:hypothetical protein